MATTAKDIIQAAFARRTANDPDKLATRAELIRVLQRFIQRVYADVAKVNKRYFVDFDEIAANEGEDWWTIPADAILVFRIELVDSGVDGAPDLEVAIVQVNDQESEQGMPRVYELGLVYRSVGYAPTAEEIELGAVADPDPETDALRMFFSTRHPALDPAADWAHANNTLHSSWPEQHNDLLVAWLALYLAGKDGRDQKELALLETEIKQGHELLLEEASLRKSSERKRWSDKPRLGE